MGFMRDGEDLMDAVSDAILSGDYSHLSDAINDTVNDVTDTIGNVTDAIGGNFNRSKGRNYNRYRGSGRTGQEPHRASSGRYSYSYDRTDRRRDLPRTAFNAHRSPGSTGLARLIAGICLGLFFGWPVLLGSVALLFEDIGIGIAGIILGLIFTIPSAWLMATGAKKRALSRKFSEYRNYARDDEYLDIGKLARYTGDTRENTLENLRQMMKNGWLPGAWIDPSGTTLILTERAYQQYKLAQESFQRRQEEKASGTVAGDEKQAYTEEVQKIISDGEKYRDDIHHANDLIPDEVMSDKLAQLETLLDRIFSQVRKKPETAKELHRLMNYYLPTTMKLVNAYIELDAQPDAGENIRKTKREIEDALDTVNAAFEKLLDSLFQDMAWDIESDINVMETMFQQDGLTEDDLQKMKRQQVRKDAVKPDEKKTWSQMKQEAGIKEKDEEKTGGGNE